MSGPSYASLYGTLIGRLEAREEQALREYRRARGRYVTHRWSRAHRERAMLARTRWTTLAEMLAEPAEAQVAA